jgi:NAD(P)-dependent dehydrogenase (short-subunit alcohol dehydrogenase family)/acyl carrier protein
VLITGGTGSLGSEVARWAIRGGAGHVLLVSRRGPDAPGAAELAAELTGLGGEVTIAACDAADSDALASVLDGIPERYPLTAVVHAAGVLDDCVVDKLTPERFRAVLRSKVDSAVALHELTKELDLTAFVLFSTFGASVGAAGQGNYVAANAFLDALAQQRHAAGLVATSIAWGPWAELGMAAGTGVGERMSRAGLTPLAPQLGLSSLRQVWQGAGPAVMIADIDWTRFLPAFTSARRSPLIGDLPEVLVQPAPAVAAGDGRDMRARLAELGGVERRKRLVELVGQHTAGVLNYSSTDEVRPGQSFKDFGFDSLIAVEFRNALGATTGLSLPATLIFDYPTPAALATYLDTRFAGDKPVGSQSVHAGIDKLRVLLATISLDHKERAGITARLRSTADEWQSAAESARADGAGEIESATAEELFDLLDDELGTS